MAGRRLATTLTLLAAAFLAAAGAAAGSKPSAKFELIHREQAPWDEVARMDQERTAFISSHARRRRATEAAAGAKPKPKARAKAKGTPPADEAFAMPLSSGAYTGTGQYFVRFRVGTPARPFLLVADTGSDLTWVKCRRRHDAPAPGYGAPASNGSSSSIAPAASSHARVFRPDRSRTWAPISCSSDTCTASLPFSLAACPTPGSPCAYDYR
jgi:hypothetical protein